MVDSIHARVKNANNLMLVAHIRGEKHLYMLNTLRNTLLTGGVIGHVSTEKGAVFQ
jgi:hypothetical protein